MTDLNFYVPTDDSDESLALRWSHLQALTREMAVSKYVDKDQGVKYDIMLNDLRHDRTISGLHPAVILGFYNAPASKERHHNVRGGLVLHLLEMWALWQNGFQYMLRNTTHGHPLIDDSSVWRGILHHDLNKVWRYRLASANPWTVDYAEDRMTALLGATHKTIHLLQEYEIYITPLMHNAIINAEGGYAKERTHSETVLAKLIYLLDETSANVIDRLHRNRFWDSKAGGSNEAQ